MEHKKKTTRHLTSRVFVLNADKTPLMPCNNARARILLSRGKAAVFRKYPFTIILKTQIVNPILQDIEVKIDPGSVNTGIALVQSNKRGLVCIFAMVLKHRLDISSKLKDRSMYRRNRRSRLRYRKPRFNNRTKPTGWLPPSIQAKVDNVCTWIDRLCKYSPITNSAVEIVSFDTQKLQNTDISGKEYQQGTLQGYKIKDYLLYRYNHTCQYCKGVSGNKILEIEHITPRSKGGTNRIPNLTLSCKRCNNFKSNRTLDDWYSILSKARKTKYSTTVLSNIPNVQKGLKPSLKHTSTMTAICNRIVEYLETLGLRPSTSPGYITKYNRKIQGYKKDHWIDAVCIGDGGSKVYIPKNLFPIHVFKDRCQFRRMVRPDKYGFPKSRPKTSSNVGGFRTGDYVKTIQPNRVNNVGRVAISGGSCVIDQNKYYSPKYCKKLHSKDGYSYNTKKTMFIAIEEGVLLKDMGLRLVRKLNTNVMLVCKI